MGRCVAPDEIVRDLAEPGRKAGVTFGLDVGGEGADAGGVGAHQAGGVAARVRILGPSGRRHGVDGVTP